MTAVVFKEDDKGVGGAVFGAALYFKPSALKSGWLSPYVAMHTKSVRSRDPHLIHADLDYWQLKLLASSRLPDPL